MWAKIVCLVIGYGFGLFQTGYFYGKRNGIDIRNMEVEMQEQQMHCVRLERKREQLLLQETV